MQNCVNFTKKWGLFSALVVTAATSYTSLIHQSPIQAQSTAPVGPLDRPNLTINVQRQSGTCPTTIGLWSFLLPFEGGAEHTAVANTFPITAQPPQRVASGEKFVEFQAPLRPNYASCVGRATSQTPAVYSFQFRNGRLTFRVDVSKLGTPYTKITYQTVTAFRPYVRWEIGE